MATTKSAPLSEATRTGSRRRVALEAARPEADAGRFATKATLADPIPVEIDAFADGHDLVAVVVAWSDDAGATWQEAPLAAAGNDRFIGAVPAAALGIVQLTFHAWIDAWSTWRRDLVARVEVDQDVTVDLQVGAALVRAAAIRATARGDVAALTAALTSLEAGGEAAVAAALAPGLDALLQRYPDRTFQTSYDRMLNVVVERERARCSAWYERFPRSTAPCPGEHGTFADLQLELPRIAAMGFDVLYLPPIHPIGREHRKGRNNAVVAGPDDAGSPWAIGSAEGGHTAIHPELGTLDDFRALRVASEAAGLELALDLAYQCAPDHPWVTEHPSWFRHRPDGTIQYAENPPKKYQDIYPIDFESEDWEELWHGLKGVVDFWVEQGVRIFRVDNPHTKAFPFWEWMIAAVRVEHPDVIFLAEAFTRPKVMARLAKLGFSQSYTYFTWRQHKVELEEYLRELTTPPSVDVMRPNFWPNTPDILTEQLQEGSRGTYVSRLVLAATASANYGIYGPAFELMESTPARPGSEEYLDSEKYEVRYRDLDAQRSLD
ncbi:MAG: alpha amylase catalytic region, partial [Thermoleophilia bacterium]|nr:alpha amylase catalytic region [Thermoleophilia bacterium]